MTEIDLIAAEGRYHRSCFRKFVHQKGTSDKPLERLEDVYVINVVDFISAYLENHKDECQFSSGNISENMRQI